MASVEDSGEVHTSADVTECTICRSIYADPRVLQCGHTFCFECLQSLADGKRSGDGVSCPLCRKTFIVPCGGVKDLPKNYAFSTLMEVKTTKSASIAVEYSYCELCSEFKEEKQIAKMQCSECQQDMCEFCANCHVKSKSAHKHKVVKIDGASTKSPESAVKNPTSSCRQHRDERIKLYCFDCKTAICFMCFVECHKLHNCSDVEKVRDDLVRKLVDDVAAVGEVTSSIRNELDQLATKKSEFTEDIKILIQAISKRGVEVKLIIDDHTESLMRELRSIEDETLKDISTAAEELELRATEMESFRNQCESLQDRGTSFEIVPVVDDLHARARELQESSTKRTRFSHADVTFAVTDLADLPTAGGSNLIGSITKTDCCPDSAG